MVRLLPWDSPDLRNPGDSHWAWGQEVLVHSFCQFMQFVSVWTKYCPLRCAVNETSFVLHRMQWSSSGFRRLYALLGECHCGLSSDIGAIGLCQLLLVISFTVWFFYGVSIVDRCYEGVHCDGLNHYMCERYIHVYARRSELLLCI